MSPTLTSAMITILFAHARGRAQPLPGVDVDRDPFAQRDPYVELTGEELHARWSLNTLDTEHAVHAVHTLTERLAALDAMHEKTYVDVRLAGFEGDGEHEIRLEAQALQRLLDATAPEESQYVIHPPAFTSHELPIRRSFLYRVTLAAPSLVASVADAVDSHVVGGSGTVALNAVDSLIQTDYQKQRNSHITLYILNPRAPRRAPSASELRRSSDSPSTPRTNASWWQKVRYNYVDDDSGSDDVANKSEARVRAGSRIVRGRGGACPVTRWVGRERYVWIDLSAGPVSFGPATTAAEDIVSDSSLPSIIQLVRRFTDRSELSRHLAVELAALTVTSTRMLLAPPVSRLPPRFHSALTILAVRITDRGDGAGEGSRSPVARAAQDEEEMRDDREWEAELDRLRQEVQPLAAHGQRVTIESVDTSLEDCHACAAALSAAMSSGTLFVSGSAGGDGVAATGRVVERQHLESALLVASLRSALAAAAQDTSEAAGVGSGGAASRLPIRPARHSERIVPVIVYSLAASDPVLLDHRHVALPFPDMVVAVQTRPLPLAAADAAQQAASPAPPPYAPPPRVRLDEHCDGSALFLESVPLARPLLAALLQSGWGAAPSSLTWSGAHNATVQRLLWASVHTPHGPYSGRHTLSFVQRDAAVRASLYALITEVFETLRALRSHFAEFHKSIDDVLRAPEHLTFLRRLNLLEFKLQRTRSYLSLHNFRHAQYYVLSTRHDLRGMRAVLEHAGASLKAGLECDITGLT